MVTVRTATRADAPAIARILSEAFRDDPAWSVTLPEDETRHTKLTSYYLRRVRRHPQWVDVAMDDGRVVAAPRGADEDKELALLDAAWAGPKKVNDPRKLLAEQGYPVAQATFWAYAAMVGLSLATIGFIFFLGRFWDVASDPIVGTLSDRTRTRFGRRRPWIAAGGLLFGVGSALLEHRLRVVDHSANPLAFLESTTPASRRLYERFGFEAVGSVPTLPGQSSTAMVRRPVGSADRSDRPDGRAE